MPASMTTCTGCRQTITWEGPRKDGACTGRCRCGEWFASAGLQRAEGRRAAAASEAGGSSAALVWTPPFEHTPAQGRAGGRLPKI